MASPQAAGGAALLLSAAKANGIKVTPPQLRRAIYSSAAPIPGEQGLGAFARDARDVIGTGTLRDRVRECAGDNCQLIFLDTSRPGNRRWCSMERCGNRSKVRAHRARRTAD